jgi:hypothetical protein
MRWQEEVRRATIVKATWRRSGAHRWVFTNICISRQREKLAKASLKKWKVFTAYSDHILHGNYLDAHRKGSVCWALPEGSEL